MDESNEKPKSYSSEGKKAGNVSDGVYVVTKTTLWQGISAALAVLFAVSLFTGGFGLKTSDSPSGVATAGDANLAAFLAALAGSNGQPPSAAPPAPSGGSTGGAASASELTLDEALGLGNNDAPVTMVEFADYQCPFCGRFFKDTLSQIKKEYIDTGKMKFYIKDFPLESIHPQARPAANAARCAAEQDKFWAYHDLLFENQGGLNEDNYKKWAADIGMNTARFDECFDSRRYDDEVSRDFSEGSSAGVGGTPGFLINDKLVSGARPFSDFKRIIDAELAAAG